MIELPPGRPCLSTDDLNRLIRRHGLGRPIAQAMIIDEIVQSVPLDGQEAKDLIASHLAANGVTDEQSRQTYLDSQALGEEDLLWLATMPRRLEIHRQRVHGPDVESRFLDRKLELDKVVYSLIRVRDADLAAELYQQIRDGEAEFSQLASNYSDGQERLSHGLVGPVPVAAAHPDLINCLRNGKPGQLFKPFFVVDIWLVVRLERYMAAQLDDAMREQLEWELFEYWCQERVRRLLAGESLATDAIEVP